MKGLVKYAAGPGNMEIRDVAEPTAAPGQIKIAVNYAGVCGSDLHIYHSDIAIPVRPPVVVGHEFSGTIAEIGEGVAGFKIGDRVVSQTAYEYCGTCHYCHTGYFNLCPHRRTLGYWFDGIFAPYTVVPAARVMKIPENVSDISAAMSEPLACVCHAAYDLCRIVPGDVVLVTGPGAIGIMAAQVAKAHGAKVVISGMAVDAPRLELAKQLGADFAVNVEKEDLAEVVMTATAGNGADVVLECAGVAPAIDSALNLIKRQGYFVQIGLPGEKIPFDVSKIAFKELKFTGSLGSRRSSWEQSLALQAAGMVKLEPMADVILPLEQWQEAFRRFEAKEGCKFMFKM
ncbi:MAG: zinc-binding dehydrogenase [Defluviitaleaceae bacterium]|nr:zinc-binding dehydrogenase [Defluviitaleaceae bacterium]